MQRPVPESPITRWLQKQHSFVFVVYAITAAFGAYFCMYAFRKPFSVATFDGMTYAGVDYKIWLIVAQVIGYTLSKFSGIKVISELRGSRRVWLLLLFIGIAHAALLLFALTPVPYNIGFLFLNGIPLGMVWGIVFSYLEGRQFTELLGAGLSASFIVASGAVKTMGKWVMTEWGVSQFLMPFVTGLLFLPPMLLFAFLLNQLPPPTPQDEALRTHRQPMYSAERHHFFKLFAPGFILLVGFYILLTAFRDFRDNFAAELWTALGYGNAPYIFTASEIPIAIAVLIILGATMLIKNNMHALITYHFLIGGGAALVGISTWLYQVGILHPAAWMVLTGFGLYVGYVPFGCVLFDRLIAAFKYTGTSGFMIYVADAFGYLGSVGVLLYKNFGQPQLSWLQFFIASGYVLSAVGVVAMLVSVWFFYGKHLKTTSLIGKNGEL
ncbi:MAG TPA: DUF5690 family protein [Chitinophagales bacterium]|nr:DUF5690 family protein [Chitinophagales bacterium]HRK28739.1 DUF5690 family protein [Chitinophagales bacterium]